MREIKFRAWDKTNKKMLPSLAHIGERGEMYTCHFNEEPDVIPMQYTGLKDKNGVEIYEDDIVRVLTYKKRLDGSISLPQKEKDMEENIFTVYWDNDLSRFWNADGNVEVIGNIYENKELLK